MKKNCRFKGDVNLDEGEYILRVTVCNTASACETKEVRFYYQYDLPVLCLDKIKAMIENTTNRLKNLDPYILT
ncbi:MAG: hypothetical protein ACP5QK_00805 [Myxococcota bacterium]